MFLLSNAPHQSSDDHGLERNTYYITLLNDIMKDLSSMPRMLLTAHASVENPDCSCLIVSKEKKRKKKKKEKKREILSRILQAKDQT